MFWLFTTVDEGCLYYDSVLSVIEGNERCVYFVGNRMKGLRARAAARCACVLHFWYCFLNGASGWSMDERHISRGSCLTRCLRNRNEEREWSSPREKGFESFKFIAQILCVWKERVMRFLFRMVCTYAPEALFGSSLTAIFKTAELGFSILRAYNDNYSNFGRVGNIIIRFLRKWGRRMIMVGVRCL